MSHADEGDAAAKERAAELKQQGDAKMDELHYAEAIEAYSRGYSVHPDPALLYNRGRAHQARGEFVEALADFEEFRDTATDDLLRRVPRLDELIHEMEGRVGELVIVCTVKGASVTVDGESIGHCPIRAPIALSEGEVEVEARAAGHHPFRRRLELPGGETTRLAIRMGRVEKTALLRIRGPSDAEAFVDGKLVGRPPAETTVSPGRHRIVLRRPAYREAQSTVVVKAGEHRDLEIEVKDRKPITSRWWFWTAVGVSVAAGVTTAALLIEKPPDDGENFTPGRVSGPLVIEF